MKQIDYQTSLLHSTFLCMLPFRNMITRNKRLLETWSPWTSVLIPRWNINLHARTNYGYITYKKAKPSIVDIAYQSSYWRSTSKEQEKDKEEFKHARRKQTETCFDHHKFIFPNIKHNHGLQLSWWYPCKFLWSTVNRVSKNLISNVFISIVTGFLRPKSSGIHICGASCPGKHGIC